MDLARQDGPGPAPRVVIVDDDENLRGRLRAALQDAGLIVIAEADNGRDAIDLAIHFRPDVVLMDVVMVGMDGISATRAIAARALIQYRPSCAQSTGGAA